MSMKFSGPLDSGKLPDSSALKISETSPHTTKKISEASPQTAKRTGPLEWWYRIAAPPEPPSNATLKVRENARRGRLTSLLLLIMIVLFLVIILTAGIFSNHSLGIILSGVEIAFIVAVILNQRQYVLFAGIIVVLALDLSVVLFILSSKQGLDLSLLPAFDIFVLPELLAVSLLPPRSVFLVALAHIAFIVASLTFLLPHAADLDTILRHGGLAQTLARPIVIQLSVAIVTYLWVGMTNQALARADRAEEISLLEQQIIERQQQEITQKQQLDEGIQQILQVHVRVANGDFATRAPLNKGSILWQVAYSLNNLLARLQSLGHADYELQRAKVETARLVSMIHQARQEHRPLRLAKTGTHLDALILELSNALSDPR
jgi:hypothetical protein